MMKSDFNFEKLSDGTYLITNYAGRYCFLFEGEFREFCTGGVPESKREILRQNYFWSDGEIEKYILNYSGAIRAYRDNLFTGTGLHIFVLTTQCNLKCVYCQASTESCGNMMPFDISEKCVDLALQSPNRYLSFEFQGGEPLLNFDTMKHIVLYAEEHKGNKEIAYNVVTNLTVLTEEMASFIKEYKINVSTSLDGSESLQNSNRPYPSKNSYFEWRAKYDMLKALLGHEIGAIQTTTKQSLNQAKEIVDEYIRNGFTRVFLRPLTPLGYASTRWPHIGYTAEEYLEFYTEAFRYILKRAKEGVAISEGHAAIFLDKILNQHAGSYTELTSPCGAGLGQLAYNYDGRIYTCDEGRMMAEMGDHTFLVGTVDSEYADLFNSPTCKAMAHASCLECIPECADCVYAPYCGTCPVLTYYENKSIFASEPNSYKCKIYKGILNLIFEVISKNDPEEMKILRGWVGDSGDKDDDAC